MDNIISRISSVVISSIHPFVVTLARFNEVFICFNAWAAIPDLPWQDPSSTLPRIITAFTTLAYVISEPILTKTFLSAEIPPWATLLVLSPVHLLWSLSSMDIHRWIRVAAIPGLADVSVSETGSTPLADKALSTLVIWILIQPFWTLAAINAALLLLAQSLYAPFFQLKDSSTSISSALSVVIYLVCRYSDYVKLSHVTWRLSLSPETFKILGWTMFWNIVLLGVRAVVRSYASLHAFEAFRVPNSTEAELKFGALRYKWIEDTIPFYLQQTLLILIPTSLVCTLLGRYLMFNSVDNRSQHSLDELHKTSIAAEKS